MTDTNYIASIVRVLETPKEIIIKNNIAVAEFRVQIPQLRKTKIVNLVFWGNLARDVAQYYKVNDYILIEGYLALPKTKTGKKAEIVVLKVYPFLFSYDRSIKKS